MTLDEARSLHTAIRRVLLEEWDPVGVAGNSEALDEYDAYVAHVQKPIVRRAGAQEIADYLWWVETEHMELRGDRQRTNMVTALLRNLA